MNQVYSIVMLALVAFVTTAQTARGQDVIRLENGQLEPNTLHIGAPNSSGVTMLPNGTWAAFVNGAVGSTIGPVHVIRQPNGDLVGTAHFHVGSKPVSNESDSKVSVQKYFRGYLQNLLASPLAVPA